jgi:cysteine-rich repeat protein
MRGTVRILMASVVAAGCFTDSPDPTSGVATEGTSNTDTSGHTETSASESSSRSESASGEADEATSGSTTTFADSTSTDPGPACGNGIEEAGEACDDGNDDDLDGCTRTCKPSPQRVMLVAADPAPGIGNLEDPEFSDPCPFDRETTQVLGSIAGNLGGPARPGWPVSIRGDCRELEIIAADEGPGLLTTAGSTLPEHGLPPNVGEYETACPPGTVAVGVRGQVFNSTKTYLVSLALWCSIPQLVETDDGYVVELSSAMPTDLIPADSGAQIEQSFCPSGTVVRGLHGAAVDSIDYLSLPCATLVVEQ